MRTAPVTIAIALMCIAPAAHAAAAAAPPLPDTCLPGISAAEHRFALPAKLLQSIGIVESGRPDPASGHVTPWPWTINVAGTGYVFPTKSAAIETVQTLQSAGVKSIDVGCMQINLMHHPNAFASLDEAFSPSANTQYGARFLSALYRETGNWPRAAAAYHSRTDEIGVPYETRIMAIWPLARKFPDATLQQRAHPVQPGVASTEPNTTGLTPEFAARVRRMHADYEKLAARFGPPIAPAKEKTSASF